MLKQVDSQEISQIQIALEGEQKRVRFRGLFYIFWGIILSKCIFAEWAIRHYGLPVNSLYVWVPTMIFASVSTFVYAGTTIGDIFRRPLTGRFVSAIWGSSLMAIVLVTVVGYGAGNVGFYVVPELCAVVFGSSYFIHSVIDSRFLFKLCAYGWWLGSIWLLVNPNLHSLAWFAAMILLFQVLPAAWLYINSRRYVEEEI